MHPNSAAREGQNQTLREWLLSHREQITHFRPRRWCGVEMLLAYNRREMPPYINGQPLIPDDAESAALIREVLGNGFIEERFASMSAGKY
jgi:hypothetical protein